MRETQNCVKKKHLNSKDFLSAWTSHSFNDLHFHENFPFDSANKRVCELKSRKGCLNVSSPLRQHGGGGFSASSLGL